MPSKMLRKIIFLGIVSIFLSGCTSKYEITLNEDSIEDNIYIMAPSEVINNLKEKEMDNINEYILDFERGYEYYKKELDTDTTNTWYKYNYDFKYEEYDAMSILSKCYDKLYVENENEITIGTSNEFLCKSYYPMDEYQIIIKSDYKNISNNADEVVNNSYIWNIDSTNYKNKAISISFSNKELESTKAKNNNLVKLIISLGVVGILLGVGFVLKKKKN